MNNSIEKCINEEIESFLSEGYTLDDERFKFKEENVQYVEFVNYESFSDQYDVEVLKRNISVDWKIRFWLNDAGIENIFIEIEKVEGEYTVNMLDRFSGDVVSSTNHIVADNNWDYQINTTEIEFNQSDTLYVGIVQFDFKNKTIIINFD
jgi:hypothetical protein